MNQEEEKDSGELAADAGLTVKEDIKRVHLRTGKQDSGTAVGEDGGRVPTRTLDPRI